jgi:hypothetical protein
MGGCLDMNKKFFGNLLTEYKSEFEGFSKPVQDLIGKFGGGYGFFTNELDSPTLNTLLEKNFKKLISSHKNRFENSIYSFGDMYGEDATKYVVRHDTSLEDIVLFMFLDSKGGRRLSDVLKGLSDEERIKFLNPNSTSLSNYIHWDMWA